MTEIMAHYELLPNGKGRLLSKQVFETGIKGHFAETSHITLYENGILVCRKGMVWDFGTGAIDDPSMVYASLFHDAFCILTNKGLVPWKLRKKGDAHFRHLLIKAGCMKIAAWWRWTGVRLNSMTLARMRRDKK